jgi:aspartate/methionine/tyrosine aminotransferase
MFSKRLGSLEENELWRVLSLKRAAGDEIFDLTESNPTQIGLEYPSDAIVEALAQPGALTYEPAPQGHLTAREAVARYYRERGKNVSTDDIVLTAGTSEAYSFLFKLLCEPGDEVLVPQPSYPLFETLASLEAVVPVPYSLDHGPAEALSPRCRAILVVHPNNPTGSYVSEEAAERLVTLSRDNDVALIVDEVFLDYTLRGTTATSFAGALEGLVFVLSGLSKLAGLPQMKLSWITIGGATARREEARRRLEHIADAFLSVGTPVQLAAPRFLELASGMRERIRERVEENLSFLEHAAQRVPEVTFPIPEGGWYAALRLPAVLSSEAWAIEFLERASVYVHPGDLFGFARDAHVVISLLAPPERLRTAFARVLDVVSDRVNSSGA